MTAPARPDRTGATESARVLRAHLDEWVDLVRCDAGTPDEVAATAAAVHAAFVEMLTWIERCPERCQEAGWWWGGTGLDHVTLPLPDLIALVCPSRADDAVEVLRGVWWLRSRGWLTVTEEWLVSLSHPDSSTRSDAP